MINVFPVACVMITCPWSCFYKSQIFQLARALAEGDEIVAEIAPAYAGQFGDNITPRNLKAALQELGFSEFYEVALGADIGAVSRRPHGPRPGLHHAALFYPHTGQTRMDCDTRPFLQRACAADTAGSEAYLLSISLCVWKRR